MFYLNAPDVNVSILETEDSALARLTHFATHNELNDELEYIKYLEISSLLDYAGFLCLRAHASLSNDCTLREMIIEGECFLITERLNLLKPSIFRKYLIKIIEDIQLLNTTDDNIENLLKVCLEYKNKQHEPCNECCNLHSIEVPWQKCLSLVSSHKLSIIGGTAVVPCNQWNNLLIDLFRIIYTKSLFHICRCMSSLSEKNLQVEYLRDKINDYYYSKVGFWKNINEPVSLVKLNKQLLPPCMSLSLNSLYTNHRLAHNPRYQLTLFFKEIGVPLDDTLLLFKQEYSKFSNSESTCIHTWENHYKSIEYNVRHTYGTVGSKKNYKMPSCMVMQKQNIQVSDEGCCPFVHMSENKLKHILKRTSNTDLDMNIINKLRNSDQPIRACHLYARKLFQMTNYLGHNTPTQYFFSVKKTQIECDLN